MFEFQIYLNIIKGLDALVKPKMNNEQTRCSFARFTLLYSA